MDKFVLKPLENKGLYMIVCIEINSWCLCMSNSEYLALAKDTKIVAAARFNKARRLKKKSWWSLFSISSLSMALIFITIFEKTNKIKEVTPFLLFDLKLETWVVTIMASIIILAISIGISAEKVDVQYEKITESAININRISREISGDISNNSKRPYSYFLMQYNKIIELNTINHDLIDYIIAKNEVNKKDNCNYLYNKHIKQHFEFLYLYFIFYVSFSIVYSIIIELIK